MRRATRWTVFCSALLLSLLVLGLYGCTPSGPHQAPKESRDADVREHDRLGLVDPTAGATDQPTVLPSKAAVIVNENKSYAQVRANLFFKGLGDRYGHATKVTACTHPSQPNYVCIAAGSTRGITSNTVSPRLTGPTIMGRTIKAGGTAAVFAQSQGSDTCRMSQNGYFHPRHYYGWPLFKDERALCEQWGLGYEKIKPLITEGKLPQLTLIVPNNCSNSHDCSLATAARWNQAEVERLMAGPDYKSGELLIVVTWDEDDKQSGNHIDMVLIHPSLEHKVVTAPLSLISLHRTLARFGHVAPIGTKWQAHTDLATAFRLGID